MPPEANAATVRAVDPTLEPILSALAEQQAELSGLLSSLDDRDWERPSACEGWSVADVVLHLAQTNEMALASLEGRLTRTDNPLASATATGAGAGTGESAGATPDAGAIDQGADLLVAQERGEPAAAVHQRWRTSVDRLEDAFRAGDPHRRVQWVAGQLSTRTLATTRLAETWIHTGDIAFAFDTPVRPADRLQHIARLAWRTLPYAFAQAGRELAGPVVFQLRGPNGDLWRFAPPDADLADHGPVTTVRGDAVELCRVAARRVDPTATGLEAEGPDADAVLQLVRTYA